MREYEPRAIEQKWQRVWEEARAFNVPNPDPADAAEHRPKTYVVEMLPYPSGELHMGHVLNYTIGDVVTHVRPRRGFQGLRPMGYASFGLPAYVRVAPRRIDDCRRLVEEVERANLHAQRPSAE